MSVTYCPKCDRMATTVTLGGFLTVTRCDLCRWFKLGPEAVSPRRLGES